MRFKSLGSGSTGNAAVVEAISDSGQCARLLIDCGLSLKVLQTRLAAADLSPTGLDAIFITHEHGDHVGCVLALAHQWRIPVWMSRGTHLAMGSPDFSALLHVARDGDVIDLGAMQITPFTVPHDAREPLQLTCNDGSTKLGVLTDLGHATDHVMAHLENCAALVLECNHDPDLLAQSGYPAFLKARVGGPQGHLSNKAATMIASHLRHTHLKYLVAAHLSEQNNSPALARQALVQAMGEDYGGIVLANAREGSPWLVF